MRGRPPKPTTLKIIAGTARPSRINAAEPQPALAEPDAPECLSDCARKHWDRLSAMLYSMHVLTQMDEEALAALCEALGDAEKARASLAHPAVDGGGRQLCAGGSLTYVTDGKAGPMIRPRPEVTMIADADRRVALWLSRFGLTPADRARVQVSEPRADASPWDALFEGA